MLNCSISVNNFQKGQLPNLSVNKKRILVNTEYWYFHDIHKNFFGVIDRPNERGVSRGGAPGPMSLGAAQATRGKKTRVYLEQGRQNQMCAFVNM